MKKFKLPQMEMIAWESEDIVTASLDDSLYEGDDVGPNDTPIH